MARILVNSNWYNELSPTSLYETEYERIILQNADQIFPEYFAIPFKPLVYTEFDSVKPDLAIIDKKYRSWWVIEVELSTHSFTDHVFPQLRKLSSASYEVSLVDSFIKENPRLNSNNLISMLKGRTPNVLLILNKPMIDWTDYIKKFDVTTMVVEVFRSDHNSHLLRINGEYPKTDAETISECYLDPVLRNFLILESPGGVTFKAGEEVDIHFGNYITKWKRLDISNKVYLTPLTKNPLNSKTRYKLIESSDNAYTFIL